MLFDVDGKEVGDHARGRCANALCAAGFVRRARVFEIVKPADRVEIVRASLRIEKAHIFVDQHAALSDAEVVADQLPAAAVEEDDSVDARVLQHRAEERRRQQVEMDVALRVHVAVQRVQRREKRLVREARVSGGGRFHLQRRALP